MPHCFSPKERPNWEALPKPSLFYIVSVVSQVLIYRWLFLQVSHKVLAENPTSVASEMVSKPLVGKHMGVRALGRAWGVNQLRLWFPPGESQITERVALVDDLTQSPPGGLGRPCLLRGDRRRRGLSLGDIWQSRN